MTPNPSPGALDPATEQAWAEIRDTMADSMLNPGQKKAFVVSILKGQLANPPPPRAVPDPKGPEAENKAFTEWFTWSGVGKEYEYAAREGWFARSRLKAQAGAAPNGSPYLPHPGGKEDRGICPGCSVDVFPPAYSCHTPGCGGVRKSKPGAPNGVREAGPTIQQACGVILDLCEALEKHLDKRSYVTKDPDHTRWMAGCKFLASVAAAPSTGDTDQAPAKDEREPIIAANDEEAYREMMGGKLKWAINAYEDDNSLSWHDISQALYALRHASILLAGRPVVPERPMEGGKA